MVDFGENVKLVQRTFTDSVKRLLEFSETIGESDERTVFFRNSE